MPIFNILMILTVIVSILICGWTWRRLQAYNRKYPLPESKYTKLYHFITKEHVMFVYIGFVTAQIIFTFWLLITL